MSQQRNTRGLKLLRMVGGQAIKRKGYASFTHDEIRGIIDAVDLIAPRTHRTPVRRLLPLPAAQNVALGYLDTFKGSSRTASPVGNPAAPHPLNKSK